MKVFMSEQTGKRLGWASVAVGIVFMLDGNLLALGAFVVGWLVLNHRRPDEPFALMGNRLLNRLRNDLWLWLCITRTVWQFTPGFATALLFCLTFWVVPLLFANEKQKQKQKTSGLVGALVVVGLAGVVLNQVVVLTNGGFMPVVGGGHAAHDVWVTATATSGHKLLWLADRFGGFSVGDFLVLWAIAMQLCEKAVRRALAWQKRGSWSMSDAGAKA